MSARQVEIMAFPAGFGRGALLDIIAIVPAFFTSPALLLAAIAGTGALLGGVVVWARQRQRRATRDAERAREVTASREGSATDDRG
jgi:hypothetical protein